MAIKKIIYITALSLCVFSLAACANKDTSSNNETQNAVQSNTSSETANNVENTSQDTSQASTSTQKQNNETVAAVNQKASDKGKLLVNFKDGKYLNKFSTEVNLNGTKVKFATKYSEDTLTITVNGKAISKDVHNPSKIVLFDIDSDGKDEILYYDDGPSDDYTVSIFKYNDKLIDLTKDNDVKAQDLTTYAKEKGVFSGDFTRGKTLCTWYHSDYYRIVDGSVVNVTKDITGSIYSANIQATAKKNIKAYKSSTKNSVPSSSKSLESYTIKTGQKTTFVLTDDKNWWGVSLDNNLKKVNTWINIKDIQDAGDYFDGLPMYD